MERTIGRPKCKWKDNFKVHFKKYVDTVHVIRKKVQWLPE